VPVVHGRQPTDPGRRRGAGAAAADHFRQLDQVVDRQRRRPGAIGMLRGRVSGAAGVVEAREQRAVKRKRIGA